MIEKIKQNDFLSCLMNEEKKYRFELTGGAIVDILEDRKPKDYDFISIDNNFLKNCDFQYSTSFSDTYLFKNYKIQVLKTQVSDFEFKISQSTFKYSTYLNKIDFNICELSFNNKTLIPSNYNNPIQQLKRITHWKKKGYSINDITFNNLVTILNKDLNQES